MHGGRLVAQALKRQGTTHLFTLGGGHIQAIYDGLNWLPATFDALGNSTLVGYYDAGNRTLTTQANGLREID